MGYAERAEPPGSPARSPAKSAPEMERFYATWATTTNARSVTARAPSGSGVRTAAAGSVGPGFLGGSMAPP